jgi:hypothetical protein
VSIPVGDAQPPAPPAAPPVAPPTTTPPPPVVTAPAAYQPVLPPIAAPRGPRRPIFGWIGFALIVLAVLALAGILIYAYLQTQDAFIQGPPWWALTSQLASAPVGILCFLGLVFGIIGAARREKPGWPAISAMIFALPGFGYVAFAAYVWFSVTLACSSPPGACGV